MAKGWQRGWREIYKLFMQRFYIGKTCEKCGKSGKIEYHHIDPSTKFKEVIHMWSYTPERIQEEVDKCRRLCKKCHLEAHR